MVRAFRHVWFAGMYEFDLVLLLLQQMCVFLVIAWLMSKTRLFIPLMQVTVRLPHKLLCYVTFSIFCIMGTYFGLHIEDSIANTRAIGAVMGGLLGGPAVSGLKTLSGRPRLTSTLCTSPPSSPSTMVETMQLKAVIPPSE